MAMTVQNLAKDSEDFTGNVWLIENNDCKALVDVGTGDCWQSIAELEDVDQVIITHSHYDHVDNLPKTVDLFSPEVYAYKPGKLPVESREISEGETLDICGIEFEIFHTPGHKDDSITLYSPQEKVLFTGDLLFPDGGFGRTDLDEGDRELLINSIEKLVNLEVEEMYCGHEDAARENVESQIERSLEKAGKKEPKY